MTQALTRYEDGGLDTMQLGQVLAKSGYFQDARDAAQAIVKVLAGRELGIGPVASMTGIYIVKGRVTLSANLMAAQIKRSGRYNYRVNRIDDSNCEIEFFELFARAMSNGAKWYCPDVFSGPVYTPDELQATPSGLVDTHTGEIIDAPQEPSQDAQQASYEPPAPAVNGNGQKRQRTREELLARIARLTEQAVSLDLEIELAKPLDKMTREELIQYGGNLKAAIDQAQQSGGMPSEPLPAVAKGATRACAGR